MALLGACGGPPAPNADERAIAAIPRRAVPAEGLLLSVLEAGDPSGRTLLYIHGTPGDATGWADYLRTPLPGFHVLAVDRPGFGQSGPRGAVPSLKAQAAAISVLLPHGGRAVIVGHSLGAPIAAQLAVDYPGRVGALVLLAGSLDPSLEKLHWAQPIAALAPVKALLPRALRNANAELMGLKPELEALAPRLAALTCPVVIVHGT
ncbi:MAG: alpha/beta fold hydrolase, partial [Sandaracinobacteroides sp.]